MAVILFENSTVDIRSTPYPPLYTILLLTADSYVGNVDKASSSQQTVMARFIDCVSNSETIFGERPPQELEDWV